MSLHKYIRHKQLGFILWPKTDLLIHADMAKLVGGRSQVMSAGFADLVAGTAVCLGRSESLDIDSLPEDSDALNTQFSGLGDDVPDIVATLTVDAAAGLTIGQKAWLARNA